MLGSLIPASLLYKMLNKSSRSVVGAGTHFFLVKGWKGVTKKDPPLNPVNPETSWVESVIWGVLAGAVIGGLGAVARKLVADGWKKHYGTTPVEPQY